MLQEGVEMSKDHFPSKGDKVNDTRRPSPYQNGFVIRILYDDGPDEVIVRFDDEVMNYEYEEFRYSWTDTYGGVFILT